MVSSGQEFQLLGVWEKIYNKAKNVLKVDVAGIKAVAGPQVGILEWSWRYWRSRQCNSPEASSSTERPLLLLAFCHRNEHTAHIPQFLKAPKVALLAIPLTYASWMNLATLRPIKPHVCLQGMGTSVPWSSSAWLCQLWLHVCHEHSGDVSGSPFSAGKEIKIKFLLLPCRTFLQWIPPLSPFADIEQRDSVFLLKKIASRMQSQDSSQDLQRAFPLPPEYLLGSCFFLNQFLSGSPTVPMILPPKRREFSLPKWTESRAHSSSSKWRPSIPKISSEPSSQLPPSHTQLRKKGE